MKSKNLSSAAVLIGALRVNFVCLLLLQVYMAEMQSQWSWLLQLSVCLEAHVKHASAYYQV